MLKMECKAEDRKVLVKRMGELTGIKPKYLRTPSMAYEIGDYRVEKDGTLTVDNEKADGELIRTLVTEGLVSEPEEEQLELNIELPLSGHTGRSLKNLMNLFYSRGEMLSKATGGYFAVDKSLIEALTDTDDSEEAVKKVIAEHSAELHGIELTQDRIRMTGFPAAGGSDAAQAFTDLAALMNQSAISQQRIQAKQVDDSNEKYIFRIWLIRLGMNGERYKKTRKILLSNLGGCVAFKTSDQLERAKQKAKEKRAAQRVGHEGV